MAEEFVADCVTRMDHLCQLWFKDSRTARPIEYRIVHPVATFVKPDKINYVAIICMVLLTITLTAIIMQFTRQRLK